MTKIYECSMINTESKTQVKHSLDQGIEQAMKTAHHEHKKIDLHAHDHVIPLLSECVMVNYKVNPDGKMTR